MSVKITYFVHGTTTDNEQNLSSGWNDVELSEEGISQSWELTELTEDLKFDAVFCSNLKRAIDSAEITWGGMYPIMQDARLRECNYGDLNGQPSDIVEPLQVASVVTPMPAGSLPIRSNCSSFRCGRAPSPSSTGRTSPAIPSAPSWYR